MEGRAGTRSVSAMPVQTAAMSVNLDAVEHARPLLDIAEPTPARPLLDIAEGHVLLEHARAGVGG
jgi:hypothetical protein